MLVKSEFYFKHEHCYAEFVYFWLFDQTQLVRLIRWNAIKRNINNIVIMNIGEWYFSSWAYLPVDLLLKLTNRRSKNCF